MTPVDTTELIAPEVLPTGREEAWRFTPFDRLNGLVSADTSIAAAPPWQVSASDDVELEWITGLGGARPLPEGVDLAARRAWEFAGGAQIIRIRQSLHVPETIQVVSNGVGGVVASELRVIAEPNSKAVVVIEHFGFGTHTDNVVVEVGAGADLTVVSVQSWDSTAVHLATHSLTLAQGSHLRHCIVTLGGDLVRIAPHVRFTGPGAEVELLGLFFATNGQHQEHRLRIEHSAPHCTSEVVYKGALRGSKTHTVWIGDVLIQPQAVGTKTYELNRNLVLGGGARADSVPNLEILTGEVVGAGHASATGRFDDEQLFYLQSRGIPSAEARRLVVRGFFADLLGRLNLPDLEDRLLATLDAVLETDS